MTPDQLPPLVSLITPCYNGAAHLDRYMAALLAQTYPHIELILVDDGSTDDTRMIALRYCAALQQRGIAFHYIHQENQGQAAALNRGLAIFRGRYLSWPDADDVMHPANISSKVAFLEEKPQYAAVLCASERRDEQQRYLGVHRRRVRREPDPLFVDLIREQNVHFSGGAYLVRSHAFLDVCPQRSIYVSRGGQNWQLCRPAGQSLPHGLYSGRPLPARTDPSVSG